MKSKFFINRPILSIALAMLITLVGAIGFNKLPVEQFPDIAPPVVEVSAEYTGASADAVQKSVIVPLEEAINGVEGIDYISSSSTSNGIASIYAVFKPGVNPDIAVVMVKNRIGEVEGILPEEVIKTGVHVEKEQQAYLKVLALECPDNRYDNDFITNYFNINISPRLQRIKGVSQVQLLGNVYAMRIWMDPKRMAFYDLSPQEIEDALNAQNIEAAIGTLGEDSKNTFQYTLVYRGRLISPKEFEDIVLKDIPGGGELRLGDVARCELGTENYSNDGWVNSHNGTVAILTQSVGSNAQQANNEIDQLMEQMRPNLPPGLEFKVLLDTNYFLNASMAEVNKTLLEALILVVLVVLLFIQNARATLIPTIAIVVSLVGTFAFMYVAGFSLNLITLFALVLVIGTVVDDAIVVVEAVQNQFETGERRPYHATVGAMSRIGTAVITTTIVFMCVFIPTSFLSGLSGTYYKQFGLTMAVAVAISTLNALTLSPALCALLMKAPEKQGKFFTAFNTAFATMTEKYLKALTAFTRHKWVAAVITVITIVLAAYSLHSIPTSLIPDEDTGNIFVDITTPAGSTLEQTKKSVKKATEAVADIEEIESCASVAGWNILGGEGPNTGVLIIKLKHWDERPGSEHDIEAVLERVEASVDSIKTASMFVFPLPTVTGYGFGSGIELNVQDFEGGPVSKLKETTDLFVNALKEREEIGEVYCTYEINFPQYTVSVNAAICKHYGIEASAVLHTLNGYISSNYASQYNAFGHLYHVMLQTEPELRAEKDDLNNIFVISEDGKFIPITELVTLKKSYGVQSLNRFNLFSSISVEVEPDYDYSTGDAIKAIDEVAEKVLPQGYGFEFSGTTREEVNQTGNAIWIFLLVIVFIYLVLCSLYENLFVPLAVLLSVPFGLVGCCLFAILFELENNIYMQVGIIMIIGLLSKTAILLTEYASKRRQQGLGIREAALEAAKVRLRPITMTALTLIIGLLPLAFASGAGAVGNISLGLCIIGGMIVGTLSLLFFVPLFFIFFQLLEERYIPTRKNVVGSTLVVLIGFSGMTISCKTFSNYDSQQINTDSIVRSDLSVATTDELVATKGWREMFTDPHLVELIEEGLAKNSDLNIAKLHIGTAKAMLRNAKGELFPSLDVGIEGSTSRFGLRNRQRSGDDDEEDDDDDKRGVLTESAYTFGATLSWEVDIFGKKQNAKKAAAAGVEEKYAQLQTVIVELISTIATSYYQLAMYDAQITEAHTTIENWQEYIRTQKALMTVGEATSDDVAQAEASCLEAETTLEQLTLQMQQAENALCSVLGRQSGHIERSDFKTILQSFKEISSINIRALTSRPDIRQAEAELKQAFYATNEARAAFYPSLNLTGSAGWTNDAGEIINPGSLLLRAIGSLTQPIFNNGRLKAELKQAEAEQEEAKINFRQRVLEAGQEVNDALASEQYARKAIALNELQVEKLSQIAGVAESRMRYDEDFNYLQVLMARQSLLEARLALLEHEYELAEAHILLYKALGGGSVEM